MVCDQRNADVLTEAGWDGPTLWAPWGELGDAPAPPHEELEASGPCLITFTSGTSGEPKAVLHGQRYLAGQMVQARHWLDARAGDLVWCTAASGWSKSARNVFIAPWLRGAAALVHDARFDPHERLELLERERVDLLCMAPTEYRVIAKRATLPRPDRPARRRGGRRAAEPGGAGRLARGDQRLDPRRLRSDRDRPAHRHAARHPRPPRLDGHRPARRAPRRRRRRAGRRPGHVPTFFLRYLGDDPPPAAPWRTGDRVERDEQGFLHFVGRTDDLIISAGYRIGPFEVESALVSHDAVAEAAVVAAPDDERGSVVRAVVVLRDGHAASDELARALQDHVKAQTAPYKYPRIVDFAAELPKTASGKIRRAALRDH